MSTDNTNPPTLPAAPRYEDDPDTKAIIEKLMTGKPLDPEVYWRIRREGERIREEIFRTHGLLDVGVPAIRALRDGEDE